MSQNSFCIHIYSERQKHRKCDAGKALTESGRAAYKCFCREMFSRQENILCIVKMKVFPMQNWILRRDKSIVFVTRRSILRKNNIKKISFVFALVLVLSMVLPMAAFAAGHIHNYTVTDASYVIPTDYTSTGHAFIECHLHTCSCGNQFYETHAKVYRPHVYMSKDAKFAYTTIGDNGETLYIYRFNCTQCNYSTLKTFTAPIS